VRAVSFADEHRGPETALTKKIISPQHWRDWTLLFEAVAKNADDVFPKVFPYVAQLADKGDTVSQRILSSAAASLAGLAVAVAKDLGWTERSFDIAKWGGVYGHSKFLDAAITDEAIKALPHARLIGIDVSPAEAAVRMAARELRARGNAA
jgi:N-acetylglucosamine kinase-like BadF-type ATPase